MNKQTNKQTNQRGNAKIAKTSCRLYILLGFLAGNCKTPSETPRHSAVCGCARVLAGSRRCYSWWAVLPVLVGGRLSGWVVHLPLHLHLFIRYNTPVEQHV